MSSLSAREKELLFDHLVGLASEKESTEARELIKSNPEASVLYSGLKAGLAPLENMEPDTCPDELAESTVLRLMGAARSSQLSLGKLLAVEQGRKTTSLTWAWHGAGKVMAAAAAIVIFMGVSIPTLNFARQKSWGISCQRQLAQIAQGVNNYKFDHQGQMPTVASAEGAPWWKVGEKGDKNHSNTRNYWLLVKGNYVKPMNFVCPGRRAGRIMKIDPAKVAKYNDFPGRQYVTYSFRLSCDKSQKKHPLARTIVASDLNPLFERIPRDFSKPLALKLNEHLLRINSSNHNRRGQNVLFRDGSVRFMKSRNIGISADDIFTLQNTKVYTGTEIPSCETDAFLAP